MRNYPASITLACGMAAIVVGCVRSSSSPPDAPPLVWVEEGIAHEGATIALGYRGDAALAGGWVEPIVSITQGGEPVANAMVFNSLVSADGSKVIADEVATLYEPASEETTAIYAQGKLKTPQGNSKSTIRFRIVLPDVDEPWTRDVSLP